MNIPVRPTTFKPTRRTSARRESDYRYSAKLSQADPLGLAWPREVISLSHVALPVAPDDPLYGRYPPEDNRRVYLGFLGLKGERGLLSIPADWLLRMRYNPFYPYLESRVIGWLEQTGR